MSSIAEAIQAAVDEAVDSASVDNIRGDGASASGGRVSNDAGGAGGDVLVGGGDAFTPTTSKTLWFPEPRVADVRVQLFGIMLGEQLNAISCALHKHKKTRRDKANSVPYSPPDYKEISCFDPDLLRSDPILKIALLHKEFENPTAYAEAVYDYAKKTSTKMPMYMHKAYTEFTKSSEIVLHLAGVYFYVSWHTEFCNDTGEISLRKMPDIFERIGFSNNMDALRDVHDLVEKYEKGKNNMTSMIDFVNKLVNFRWKKIAQPHPQKRRKIST